MVVGFTLLLSTEAVWPNAALAQREHKANRVIFIMLLIPRSRQWRGFHLQVGN
jgi:hypothetical protein